MRSMTGFGQARLRFEKKSNKKNSKFIEVEIAIRSVNGRFIEPRFHVSKEYLFLESIFREEIQKIVKRGTLDIFVTRKGSLEYGTTPQLNEHVIKEFMLSLKSLNQKLKTKFVLNMPSLLHLPGALVQDVNKLSDEVEESEQKEVISAFKKALKMLEEARIREGKALRTHLEELLEQLKGQINKIEESKEQVGKQLKDKMKQRYDSLFGDKEFDPNRVLQEMVVQIDKTDISEELQRLNEHINNYESLFKSTKGEGKKLEFYTQELLREVNTIGSKAALSKVTESVVECKTLIERLREQVQNVE